MLLLVAGGFSSCNKDELSDTSIFTEEEKHQTEFDLWLDRHYMKPYNIRFEYRLPDRESHFSFWVSPPPVEKSIKVAKAIKYATLDAMAEMQADKEDPLLFAKLYFPRVLYLVGSYEINGNGVTNLGSAENGLQINILGVTYFNDPVVDGERIAGLLMHEFSHILDGRKPVPDEFDTISATDYVGSKYTQLSQAAARDLGFLTPYAGSSVPEDIAVTCGEVITREPEWWERELANVNPEGRAKIEKKRDILIAWLDREFGVDNIKWGEAHRRRLATLDMIDWDNLED